MAFGSFDNKSGGSSAVSEINMVPLIDVMLVLLVIFIITAPLLAHSIKINLPQVSAEQIQADPKVIDIAINQAGIVFYNEQPVALDRLQGHFAENARLKPQPEIRIRADLNTRYEVLAQVLAAARRSGMQRVGFVTSPPPAITPASGAATAAGS
jgi:biopolymer transport protein ExbD